MALDQPTVLFIGGTSRSGSTVLELSIGAHDRVTALGEVRHLWYRGFVDKQLCSCGEKVTKCDYWRSIMREAYGDPVPTDLARQLHRIRTRLDRRSLAPLFSFDLLPQSYRADAETYGQALSALFEATSKVGGTDVVVDSSKTVVHGCLLNRFTELDVRTVHLIRDSRAVANSWLKKKRRPELNDEEAIMGRHRPMKVSAGWIGTNCFTEIATQIMGQYTRFRFEKFQDNPKNALEQLSRDCDLPFDLSISMDGRETRRPVRSHTASGNPVRFRSGNLRIHEGNASKECLRSRDWIVASILTAPLLLRYQYSVCP